MKNVHLLKQNLKFGGFVEWYVEGTDEEIDKLVEHTRVRKHVSSVVAQIVDGVEPTHVFDENGHLWCKTPIKINI
ncbi:hypothetical protein MOE90_21150 [Bacillus spizizenii]|nr:hypothetical protein [Bacillus spizizenii]MCY9124980.1 hypothetical protein [Bacillus spizizenii]